MSDNAVVDAVQSVNVNKLVAFHQAIDLSGKQIVVNLRGANYWFGPECGQHLPVLFRLQDGRLFYGRYTRNDFQTFRYGLRVTLAQLSVDDARLQCQKENIPFPSKLIEGCESSCDADQPAETPNQPAVSKPDPEPQATPQLEPAPSTNEALPPEGERQPPKAPADPLDETLELIPRATHGANLIQFLFRQPDRSAKLRDACKRIYKSIDKASLHKMAKVIRETRDALETRNAPLRLERDHKAKVVRLIMRNGT
jgi:hypothetical protein